jgi:ABC-type branched-subunit amino acid transport system substrate-binding protein
MLSASLAPPQRQADGGGRGHKAPGIGGMPVGAGQAMPLVRVSQQRPARCSAQEVISAVGKSSSSTSCNGLVHGHQLGAVGEGGLDLDLRDHLGHAVHHVGARRARSCPRSSAAAFAGTIKVGVLHSLSGTMAISETVLKDTVLMAIDEINAKGGVLGKKLEPVVVDPASNWPLFAEKAKQLITQDKVAVVFGCWTSVSRKSVLPVFEETNACCSTPCSTKAKSSARTCSTPVPRPTSRPFPPWNT